MGTELNNPGHGTCIRVSMASAILAGVLSIAQASWHIVLGFLMEALTNTGSAHKIARLTGSKDTKRKAAVLSLRIIRQGKVDVGIRTLVDHVIDGIRYSFIGVTILFAITSCALLFLIMKKSPGKLTSWLVVSGIHLCFTLLFGIANLIVWEPVSIYILLVFGFDVGLGVLFWIIVFLYGRRIAGEIIAGVGGGEGASDKLRNEK